MLFLHNCPRPLLPPQVHDEVILEGPRETAEQVCTVGCHSYAGLGCVTGQRPCCQLHIAQLASGPPCLSGCPADRPSHFPLLSRRASAWWRACAAPSRGRAPSRCWLTWWWMPSTPTRGTRPSRAAPRTAATRCPIIVVVRRGVRTSADRAPGRGVVQSEQLPATPCPCSRWAGRTTCRRVLALCCWAS